MFEEVPRESRGIARLLSRPVGLGPFVVGTGVLVAALSGSVAVATAATVITASAIGSDGVPARPGRPVAPASSHQHSAAVKRSSAHRSLTPAPAAPRPSASSATVTAQPGGGVAPFGTSGRAPSHQMPAGPSAATSRPSATSSPTVSTPSSPPLSPSSTGPVGNALVYFTGYDPASGRIAYQFATRESTAPGGSQQYRVSDPHTFTATLAKSATITSGGTLCPPAGSSCTTDQLLNAMESGFFAEVAIDVTGALCSVIEVGEQPAAAKVAPVPSTSPLLVGGPLELPPTLRLVRPDGGSPTPEASSAARP